MVPKRIGEAPYAPSMIFVHARDFSSTGCKRSAKGCVGIIDVQNHSDGKAASQRIWARFSVLLNPNGRIADQELSNHDNTWLFFNPFHFNSAKGGFVKVYCACRIVDR